MRFTSLVKDDQCNSNIAPLESYPASEDSEELEYPVGRSLSTSIWQNFAGQSDIAILEAVDAKKEQLATLTDMISAWSLARQKELATGTRKATLHVENLIRKIELQHAEEDTTLRTQFETISSQIQNSVQYVIEQELHQADKLRLQRLAEEKSRALEEEHDWRRENQRQQDEEQENIARCKIEASKVKADLVASKAIELQEPASEPQVPNVKLPGQETGNQLDGAIASNAELDALDWKCRLDAFKIRVLKPISDSKHLRSCCNRLRFKINPKIGQVTNSLEQIRQVVHNLLEIFAEASAADSSGLVLLWCLNFFSKALVRQAEGEVIVKPTASYPLAFLAISIMRKYPELKELFLCRVAKKCPWTIPFVQYDKATESGRKSLGWKRNGNGKYEDFVSYLERQEGIFRLWAATASMNLKSSPISITNIWRVISRLLNLPIFDAELRDVAIAMICTFMDISGSQFLKTYGTQGAKILNVVPAWLQDSKGPNASRLRILLEAYANSRLIGIDFEFEQ